MSHEVTITVLPPGPEPTRVTAYESPHSLLEHFQAFMCEHNRRGFTEEQIAVFTSNALSKNLLRYSNAETVSIEQLKKDAFKIKKLINRGLCHSRILNLLAFAMGYHDWQALVFRNRATPEARAVNLFKGKLSEDSTVNEDLSKDVVFRSASRTTYRKAQKKIDRALIAQDRAEEFKIKPGPPPVVVVKKTRKLTVKAPQ